MENITEAMMVKGMINCFLIGFQCTLMLVFLICTIIDLKNTRKDWKKTDDWIKSIDNQLKFEGQMVDMIVKQDHRLDNIEEKLGIKEEENEQVNDTQEV